MSSFSRRSELPTNTSNRRAGSATVHNSEWSSRPSLPVLRCSKPNPAIQFSPDGTLLASGDTGGNLTIWDVPSWSRRSTVNASNAPIYCLSFSPDRRALAAACGDSNVRLWDPQASQVTLTVEGHARRVNAVAFSPDGRTLASGSHDGALKLWQAESH